MSRWFRHYAGMMRDDKLVRVAIRAKQPIERIVWVYAAILESAAEIDEDGRYDFDTAEAAYFLRADEADLHSIVGELSSQGRIVGNRVVKWSDRQFSSDRSAERQRRYRERKASGDAGVRSDELPGGSNADGEVTSLSQHGDAPEREEETETKTKQNTSLSARMTETEFRQAIMAAYREVGSTKFPDAGHGLVWLAKGFDPSICIAALRAKLPGKPNAPLQYFDGPIADAHAVPRGTAKSTGPPAKRMTVLKVLEDSMREQAHERNHDRPEIISPSARANQGRAGSGVDAFGNGAAWPGVGDTG